MSARRNVGRYTLKKKILAGDVSRGIPELWTAEDYGDLFYVKLWKRKGVDAPDIRALWNREVRGLMRLQGYPGAAELFVRLHDLNSDDGQYYAVLDGGMRTLLSETIKNSDQYPWLRNLGEIGRRRPLWEGLLRISEALAVLHSEGTLHRSLSPASVFVSRSGQGDFRLSGFEWSLRVAGSDVAARRVGQRSAILAPELDRPDGEYSIATDWFDFGLLAAELFGVPVGRIKKQSAVVKEIQNHRHLNQSEKELLLRLVEENQELRLANADNVTPMIRDVIRELSTTTIGAGRPLVVALRLGVGVGLSRAVEKASKGKAPSSDPALQKKWIERDLIGDIRVTARSSRAQSLVLHGTSLEYRLLPWSLGNVSTWDIGFCDSTEPHPRFLQDDMRYSIGSRRLELRPLPEVHNIFNSIRDRSAAWDKLFPFARTFKRLEPHLRDIHDFFRVTQQLDTLLTVARICPVRVMSVERSDYETTVEITPIVEPERDELAQYLGLAPLSEQLRDWFELGAEPIIAEDDDDPSREEYQFLTDRRIDSDGSHGDWKFISAKQSQTGPRYRFQTSGGALAREGRAYLARSHGGTLAQIRRRHKAIDDLKLHEDLLRNLADPKGTSRVVGESLPEPKSEMKIDDAKLSALRSLWETRPAFAVQGPPGTGKTTLISAFIERLLFNDPTVQALITAHSHHTVDDVRKKLNDMFQKNSDGVKPIVVRLRGQNEKRRPQNETEHDLGVVTEALLQRLMQSDIASNLPSTLTKKLREISLPIGQRDETSEGELRTMQILVQDSANLTFVTSNSGDLAEMAVRGRRFDWSIIEEAGKAHGFDMAVALQESHRVLLIGDHLQLPPFNATLFKRLLAEPLRVRKAIQTGAQFAPNLIDRTLADDSEERVGFAERCALWREMVSLFGSIFERSVERDKELRGPAAILTAQHRMHPHIADLVGRIFYPDPTKGTILESPAETHENFSKESPFRMMENSWLSDHRIIWCDVPWVQRKKWADGEKEGLFASQVEAKAVVSILEQLRPNKGMQCELQVLSPYNDQLKEIKESINKAFAVGRLAHIFKPPFDLRVAKRIGATVDEFQGSEADIVIVSLVRNNGAVPWKSLGFLKEANRMNVLLSRARHKLIIVGSWEFFKKRCDEHTPEDAEYAYIGRMMREMSQAQINGHLARIEAPQ